MLSPDQLHALGANADAANSIQQHASNLPGELIDETYRAGRFQLDDPEELLAALAQAPSAEEQPFSPREYALRVAYLAKAAGALGIELVKKAQQE